MKLLRTLAAVALAGGLCVDAQASRYSDLWFNPAESGWGMNLVQQDERAFITLFLYGEDGRPLWYVASDARVVAYSNPGGLPVFRGNLYRMEGPWHGGPFDAGRVHANPVGELHVEALAIDRVRLHYFAEGVAGVKELRRQTFAAVLQAGAYAAQFSLRVSYGEDVPPEVSRYGARIVIEFDENGGYMRTDDAMEQVCEYRGPFLQAGKVVRFTGSYACTGRDAQAGTFDIDDLEISPNGLTGYLRTWSGSRAQYGHFAGARY
jgi:hypothetical protein